ncbi:MAG TPA: DUF192 domain-containing protein [Candidatus Bathyarchaeia archaeon]|nr:DUF192 domain-containing protein [Candidatus Bathyarchaeia archaeon]
MIALQAQKADSALSRLKGLLGRESIGEDEGLIITQCRSIHMFFMRFAIDVIFVDRTHKVIGLVRNIKPFQLSPYFFRSSYVIEIPPGKIDQTRTEIGDIVSIG